MNLKTLVTNEEGLSNFYTKLLIFFASAAVSATYMNVIFVTSIIDKRVTWMSLVCDIRGWEMKNGKNIGAFCLFYKEQNVT